MLWQRAVGLQVMRELARHKLKASLVVVEPDVPPRVLTFPALHGQSEPSNRERRKLWTGRKALNSLSLSLLHSSILLIGVCSVQQAFLMQVSLLETNSTMPRCDAGFGGIHKFEQLMTDT